MKSIPLTQGKVALVDDDDYGALSTVRWYAQRARRSFYAMRVVRRHDPQRKTEQMHVLILTRKLGRAVAEGMQCDHINGDGLDNRRENLREVNPEQNGRNCRRRSENPSSKYLGVCWSKSGEKWKAQIAVSGKRLHLGYHATEMEAALAREAFIAARPELNARANFPNGSC